MGVDKALLEMDGQPLVRLVADRLSQVADPILIAPGARGRLGPLGYGEVDDATPGGGPLSGIVAALEASSRPLLAVVAVDMPFASPAVLRLLARLIGDASVALPVTAEGTQPLHAVYATSALEPLRAALEAGVRGVREAMSRLRVRLVERAEWGPADPSGLFAINVNRPQDVARAESQGAVDRRI
jgi:molybdopterin-guanine dinucleotide biosynthesis protein A